MSSRLFGLLRENLLLIAIVVVIAAAYLFLRTSESDIASLGALDEQLSAGRPTLLEFFSNS